MFVNLSGNFAAIVTASFLSIFFLLIVLVGIAFFVANRHRTPITQRLPWVVVTGVLCIIVWAASLFFQVLVPEEFDCAVTVYFSHILLGFAGDLYTWRVCVLFFHYHLTQHKLTQANQIKQKKKRSSWRSESRQSKDEQKSVSSKSLAAEPENASSLSAAQPQNGIELASSSSDRSADVDDAAKPDLYVSTSADAHENDDENESKSSELAPLTPTNVQVAVHVEDFINDDDDAAILKSEESDNWYFQHRHLITWPYLGTALLLIATLQVLEPWILTRVGQVPFGSYVSQGCNFPTANIFFYAELLCFACIYISLYRSLSGLRDNLFIKDELKYSGYFCTIAALPWFITVMIPSARQLAVTRYPIIPLYAAFVGYTMSCISLYFPLYHAYKMALTVAKETTQTLVGVLSTPDGYDAFEKFLAQEFSVENLLFWSDVQTYKAQVALCVRLSFSARYNVELSLVRQARTIWKKYFEADSPFEINLPGPIRALVQQTLEPYMRMRSHSVLSNRDGTASLPGSTRPKGGSITSQRSPGTASTPGHPTLTTPSAVAAASSMTSPGGFASAAAASSIGRCGSKALSVIDENAATSTSAAATHAVMPVQGGPIAIDQDEHFEDKFFSLFDAAANDVFRLMSSDSFRRFVHSPLYEALCTKLERDAQRILSAGF